MNVKKFKIKNFFKANGLKISGVVITILGMVIDNAKAQKEMDILKSMIVQEVTVDIKEDIKEEIAKKVVEEVTKEKMKKTKKK